MNFFCAVVEIHEQRRREAAGVVARRIEQMSPDAL
jgi:hypothetical protein